MAPAAPATAPRRAPAKRSAPRKAPPSTRAQRNSRALANARATQRATRAGAAPATRSAPARRKSGPAAKTARPARTTTAPSPVARVLQSRGMPLIDRLLRGPAWVVIVGALLAGIVFLNVSVLELNRGIARTDAQAGVLERSNSGLRTRLAKLDSGERIQQLAADRGFVMPQPGDVTFVKPRRSDARLAAQRIKPPAVPVTDATGTIATTTGTTATTAAPATTTTPVQPATTTTTTTTEPQPAQATPVAQVTPTPPPSTATQAP